MTTIAILSSQQYFASHQESPSKAVAISRLASAAYIGAKVATNTFTDWACNKVQEYPAVAAAIAVVTCSSIAYRAGRISGQASLNITPEEIAQAEANVPKEKEVVVTATIIVQKRRMKS